VFHTTRCRASSGFTVPTKALKESPTLRRATACALLLYTGVAYAADVPRDPMTVLNALADRIYVLGETTGRAPEMVEAEKKAALEVRQYVASGQTEGLLAKEAGKQSPLSAAAYMGYPNVVAALLSSALVVRHINDAGEAGMTPWIAATFSARQTLSACNPAVFADPFKFVPMLVTQPYYLSSPAPYTETREILEKSGALPDVAKAKDVWLASCKNQSDQTRTAVQASTQLQKTLQELGAAELSSQLTRMQKNAAAVPQR
jgi:hypothetical protein